MKKVSSLITAVILSSVVTLALLPSKAQSQDFSIDGYTLSMVNVSNPGGMIEVSGKLEYGPSCDNLRLTFKLQNEKGRTKTINCLVKNAGTGSSLFKGSSRTGEKDDTDWKIDEVTTKCAGGKK